MRNRRLRTWTCLVAAAAVSAALALPGAASAQIYLHHDDTHDVLKAYDSDMLALMPANRLDDIKKAKYRYTGKQVAMKIWLRDYGRRAWTWSETIQTPTRSYWVSGNKEPGKHVSLQISRPDKPALECPGLSIKIRPVLDTIRVVVPARCVHRPRWVRFSMSYWKPAKGAMGYVDDPLYYGIEDTASWSLTLTPKLRPKPGVRS